ncbi:DNA-binding response regulator [Natrarchaeobius halalkaliphilus]|uniref:DNA-binding response regulator n=1 Tax=Natrarchaeobius halalkaliphilus TaxID=1679091 RepID=A0A3N6M5D0_9EURY|nr:response regulator transcription factor [Natrarchaeobius halalkaliphilus]RQG91220.1 DNA-binding response regulator [Natrarchaeobius halalkaliphilus]
MATDHSSVLIVEDEPDLADLYASRLEDEYDVQISYDGNQALESIDEGIDVVLLDRRMPGLSGDLVLETIREQRLDCRIAMVTAIEPDFDIVSMGFDDYLVKPVSKAELIEVIEGLLLRSAYDEQLQEFFAVSAKKVLLDGRKTEAERLTSQEYARLEDRIAVLRVRLEETTSELADGDGYRQLCMDISQQQSTEDRTDD